MSKYTVNNRLIVEAYKSDKALRSKVSNGFATIDQKGVLKGLRLLVDAKVVRGDTVEIVYAGDTIYIREETLHNAAWAKAFLEAPGIEGQFILVDLANVEMIDESR